MTRKELIIGFFEKGYCCNLDEVKDTCLDLLKENRELKLELSGYRQAILNNKEMLGLKEQNEKLKKQVENYKKLGFKYLQDKNNNLETQQKEFINYLEDQIERLKENDIYQPLQRTALITHEHDLQKYKEIIGVSDDKTN